MADAERIAIAVGVSGLVLIIMGFMICIAFAKRRQTRKRKEKKVTPATVEDGPYVPYPLFRQATARPSVYQPSALNWGGSVRAGPSLAYSSPSYPLRYSTSQWPSWPQYASAPQWSSSTQWLSAPQTSYSYGWPQAPQSSLKAITASGAAESPQPQTIPIYTANKPPAWTQEANSFFTEGIPNFFNSTLPGFFENEVKPVFTNLPEVQPPQPIESFEPISWEEFKGKFTNLPESFVLPEVQPLPKPVIKPITIPPIQPIKTPQFFTEFKNDFNNSLDETKQGFQVFNNFTLPETQPLPPIQLVAPQPVTYQPEVKPLDLVPVATPPAEIPKTFIVPKPAPSVAPAASGTSQYWMQTQPIQYYQMSYLPTGCSQQPFQEPIYSTIPANYQQPQQVLQQPLQSQSIYNYIQ